MKYKTSELTGELLDAAVAIAEGEARSVNYSKSWSDAGKIIERERIMLAAWEDDDGNRGWFAALPGQAMHYDADYPGWLEVSVGPVSEPDGDNGWGGMSGETPLVAAMRAYVASKLGNEVEL